MNSRFIRQSFLVPTKGAEGAGETHKAESGPIWLLASQSPHLVSLPHTLRTTWVTQKRFLWPEPLFVLWWYCQGAGSFLTLFPQQYYRGPSHSLEDMKTLSFLSLSPPKQVRSSQWAGNTPIPFVPFHYCQYSANSSLSKTNRVRSLFAVSSVSYTRWVRRAKENKHKEWQLLRHSQPLLRNPIKLKPYAYGCLGYVSAVLSDKSAVFPHALWLGWLGVESRIITLQSLLSRTHLPVHLHWLTKPSF